MQLNNFDLGTTTSDYLESFLQLISNDCSREESLRLHSVNSPLTWVCDLGQVCDRLSLWKQGFPKVHPLFSLNSYSKLGIAEFMQSFGVGFTCNTKRDIETAGQLRINSKNIFFDNTNKQKVNWRAAVQRGAILCVHDEKDVKFISTLAHESRIIVKVGSSETEDSYKKLVKLAVSKGLRVIGIGCDVSDIAAQNELEHMMKKVVSALHYMNSLDHPVDVLDLGKIFSGKQQIFDMVNAVLDAQVFPYWPHITVTADVSAYIMRSSVSIVATVLSVNEMTDSEQNEIDADEMQVCKINDGVYGSFCGLLRHKNPKLSTPWMLKESKSDECECFQVKGYTEEDWDVIVPECQLSTSVQEGDKMAFDVVGDLTVNTALDSIEMNDMQTPEIKHFIHQSKVKLAKDLKCKEFKLSENQHLRVDLEECKTTDSVLEVLIENMSLMECDTHWNMINRNAGQSTADMSLMREDQSRIDGLPLAFL